MDGDAGRTSYADLDSAGASCKQQSAGVYAGARVILYYCGVLSGYQCGSDSAYPYAYAHCHFPWNRPDLFWCCDDRCSLYGDYYAAFWDLPFCDVRCDEATGVSHFA